MIIAQYRANTIENNLTPTGNNSFTISPEKKYNKLGIQSTPGVKFTINGVTIQIGKFGIYELEGFVINSISFETNEPVIIDLQGEG